MASSINISLDHGKVWHDAHNPVHFAAEAVERASNAPYRGAVHFCPFCKARKDARDKIENIVLSAFPDLNDRSNSQYDYFDFCLSIDY